MVQDFAFRLIVYNIRFLETYFVESSDFLSLQNFLTNTAANNDDCSVPEITEVEESRNLNGSSADNSQYIVEEPSSSEPPETEREINNQEQLTVDDKARDGNTL